MWNPDVVLRVLRAHPWLTFNFTQALRRLHSISTNPLGNLKAMVGSRLCWHLGGCSGCPRDGGATRDPNRGMRDSLFTIHSPPHCAVRGMGLQALQEGQPLKLLWCLGSIKEALISAFHLGFFCADLCYNLYIPTCISFKWIMDFVHIILPELLLN